ncbi:MAG: hypothetical protein ABUS56_12525 [Acidobacteriota bacterium]
MDQRLATATGRVKMEAAMTPKNIAIEDPELFERYTEIARAEGKTVDELATEAVKRDVARRWFESNKREAEVRRGNMTDEEVEAVVERAIQESRAEQRAR